MSKALTTATLVAALIAMTPGTSMAAGFGAFAGETHLHADLWDQTVAGLPGLFQQGDEVSLNPQPLPPKSKKRFLRRIGDDVMLNPQPLPPKELGLFQTGY